MRRSLPGTGAGSFSMNLWERVNVCPQVSPRVIMENRIRSCMQGLGKLSIIRLFITGWDGERGYVL